MMRIRTIYFKVDDPAKSCSFWTELLGVEPHKQAPQWHEINCGNILLGFLKNDFGDRFSGASCVPVFEFADADLQPYIERAKALGATVLVDGLDDPHLKSIVFRTPDGHEFELSRFHD